MAAADAFGREPAAAEGTVGLEGFDRVVRAGGGEAADVADHELQEGGEDALVEADEEDEEGFHLAAGGSGFRQNTGG